MNCAALLLFRAPLTTLHVRHHSPNLVVSLELIALVFGAGDHRLEVGIVDRACQRCQRKEDVGLDSDDAVSLIRIFAHKDAPLDSGDLLEVFEVAFHSRADVKLDVSFLDDAEKSVFGAEPHGSCELAFLAPLRLRGPR